LHLISEAERLIVKYSTYDLDELIGFIAAEANHTVDKKIGKKLDRLFDKLNSILEKYVKNGELWLHFDAPKSCCPS
jgi:translation initiation factor 2 alpha subunit (eIF-2alpha)